MAQKTGYGIKKILKMYNLVLKSAQLRNQKFFPNFTVNSGKTDTLQILNTMFNFCWVFKTLRKKNS